jgi:hypothetical protein
MWESTSSNPPGPVGMSGESETWSSGQIIVITLLSGRCYALLWLLLASSD